MTAPLKPLNESPATPTAARRNSTIVGDRRSSSKIWKGFATNKTQCKHVTDFSFRVCAPKEIHDRYLIIDKQQAFHVGHSLKN
jgi:hypothetical protein